MNRHKKWRENNLELARERVRAAVKANAKKYDDGNVRVYQLKCGYIGISKNLMARMKTHKYSALRDVSDYIILATCPTRGEALDLEALYQSLSTNYKKVDNTGRLKQNK